MKNFDLEIKKLAEIYTITDPFYLSDFFQDEGSKKLYEFLKSIYCSEYSNDFRIVIVQDCVDQYMYQDLPGQALTALQKYLSQIDISNFFVTVITSNPQVERELEQVRELYSTDQCCMNYVQVKDTDYEIIFEPKDTFCVLPWMHLYTGPDGNILPCCTADRQFPMGNIHQQSIDSILKSHQFNQIRSNMLLGLRSKECARCYQQEDSGLPSSRKMHNSRWALSKLTLATDGTIDEFNPKYLDIRLNNICNLKCRMCSGYFSSSIAQEETKLFGNSEFIDGAINRRQRDLLLDEILKYLPSAEKIYFAGGEPLLMPEHYRILNALIDCGNTSLEIVYSSNFSVLTYKTVSVTELWKQFSNVTVMTSLDAIGPVAEYVRHGTNWRQIESNLITVKMQCPHVDIKVSSTVSLLTVSSLIDLQKHWHQQGMLNITKFFLSILSGPEHLSICALPLHHKTRLTNLISQHIEWCKQQNANTQANEWTSVISHMHSRDLSYLIPEFQRLTMQMDQYRGESLAAVLPELSDLMG